ncbi:heme-copper oxidase subunit III [Sphingobium sp. Sx8-8]|uniref:cytochrome c oxidase subunit 3 n=1 Tax=Sphingobium sp. Sx8-8 TaxID=2933617 RepID=UPI001F5744C9|nr:heme-copper oxidase subunit III [Sphingobium sp. Sx8-8]
MNLIARLSERSWEPASDRLDLSHRPSAGAVGLAAYAAVMAVMFSLVMVAYVMRMGLHAAMGHADDWVAMPHPPLLWINSAVLVMSSVAWEVARRAAERGEASRAPLLGGALGLCFLGGQWLLWRHYQAAGYYLASNPANAFFYLLTALHGVHIAGGLVAAAWVLASRTLPHVRLCALYWHLLLLIWMAIAVLLLLT